MKEPYLETFTVTSAKDLQEINCSKISSNCGDVIKTYIKPGPEHSTGD
jgi:hypothetical protein